MGKGKGGGGGGGHAPQAPTNPQFNILNDQYFTPFGQYGMNQTYGLANLQNWASNLATGGVQTAAGTPRYGFGSGGGNTIFAPFTTGAPAIGTTQNFGGQYGNTWGTGSYLWGENPQTTGPFLANAIQNLINAQQSVGPLENLLRQLPKQAKSEFATANQLMGTGQGMLTQATTGSGLFPSQQAMINQAVQSQQAQIAQQLSSAGLGSSTLMGSLQGQAAMSGAAAAGQLIQGNIQSATGVIGAAEQEQGIAQDTQKIDLAAQEALFSQFSQISSMSSTLQAGLWTEAMQGAGALSQMYNATLGSFGYALKSQEDIQQVAEFNVSAQMQQQQLMQQAQAAESQGFSSMLGGLGQLLGGGQGGGLLGSLGIGGGAGIGGAGAGAFGTVGDLIGGGAASAGAAGSLGALGGAGGGIIAGVGALFTAISSTISARFPDISDIRWILARDWILYRAPRFVRTFYVVHAQPINRWLEQAWFRALVLYLIDQLIDYDEPL